MRGYRFAAPRLLLGQPVVDAATVAAEPGEPALAS
jgi:hypothetical protein